MRLVARFFNEDGVEMPSLYRAGPDDGNHPDEGELICTWNYLLLVAPDLEAENRRLREGPPHNFGCRAFVTGHLGDCNCEGGARLSLGRTRLDVGRF